MRFKRSLFAVALAGLGIFSLLGSNVGCGGGASKTPAASATETKTTGRIANGINQKGQIVGVGRRGSQLRGFLLTAKF